MINTFKRNKQIDILYIKDSINRILYNKCYNRMLYHNNSFETGIMINGYYIFKAEIKFNELYFIDFYSDNIITKKN